jgi:signal transduction histidine kinase
MATRQKLEETGERLRLLSRQLNHIQERERRHIACELHDEIGQLLTGVKLLLSPRDGKPAGDGCTERALELVDELITRVQALSLDLRPSILDDLGLLPALLWRFDWIAERSSLRVQFHHSGIAERRFAADVETVVYRAIQEALTNAARHAGVDEVQVEVTAIESEIRLSIADQGAGFDPRRVLAAYTSNGLSGIRERVRMLNGIFSLEAAPGSGTRLSATLPLQEPALEAPLCSA